MEHFAKIELQGVVGTAHVQTVNGNVFVRFSVAVMTNYGDCVGTEWFNCIWWPKSGENYEKISKGAEVHLEGRMASQEYVGSDNVPRRSYEVKVQKVW